ncbi:DUF58 domain-containing protein [uncultured Microbacterium sp.]|uniref:DUF58 domain-containing protein n=1 Tax=uncultured Microbacterium sp. TaxID=191216 RepID=UPI00263324CA|nr:DUF58 domain-containing protein [uncultured Microbacterium sp.]
MTRWPLTVRGTGAALLSLLCFVLAHEFRITELIYVGVLLGAVVIASIATLHLVRRTETVVRSFSPGVAAVGSDVDVRARVDIRSPLPIAQGRWSDTLPRGITGGATGDFPAVASGMRTKRNGVEISYTVRADRRGVRRFGPLTITSTDPFGFARRRHAVGGTVTLTVAPVIVDLGSLADLPGEAGGSMHTATHQLGQGTDNLVPRHYTPGDSMRRIHWRASAHRDELMVRQEEQETAPEATVVFDRAVRRWDASAARAPGTDPGFEAAVSATVSAVARFVAEGYRVTVLEVDGTELCAPIDSGDTTGAPHLAMSLATIVTHGQASLDAVVRLFAGTMTGPLVLVTGILDETDAALLAPLAPHSSLPILLAVAPQGAALARAADSGWRAVGIGPDEDLTQAWRFAVDRGTSRVGA